MSEELLNVRYLGTHGVRMKERVGGLWDLSETDPKNPGYPVKQLTRVQFKPLAQGPFGIETVDGELITQNHRLVGIANGAKVEAAAEDPLAEETMDQLKDRARDLGIEGFSSMKKKALVRAVKKALQTATTEKE